jgi:uncharacterized protein (TIGR02246 family)
MDLGFARFRGRSKKEEKPMARITRGRAAGGRRAVLGSIVFGLMLGLVGSSCPAAEHSVIEAEVRAASAAYAQAFNRGDFAALAEQWTDNAMLIEGGSMLQGRAAIVASLRSWRERHPGCSMEIVVDAIDPIAEPLVRVSGSLRFTRSPGGQPVSSRFTSLRVKEHDAWRILESVVVPAHAAALDELAWLVGTWHADSGDAAKGTKTAVETIYEQPLGTFCLVGRSRIRPPSGPAIEALEVIHADRDTGLVRSWVFDSTGAHGEGVVESDGTTLEKTMVGRPADGVPGSVARWTQVVARAGDSRCTMHSIERSIDGAPQPDGEPLHFRKIR